MGRLSVVAKAKNALASENSGHEVSYGKRSALLGTKSGPKAASDRETVAEPRPRARATGSRRMQQLAKPCWAKLLSNLVADAPGAPVRVTTAVRRSVKLFSYGPRCHAVSPSFGKWMRSGRLLPKVTLRLLGEVDRCEAHTTPPISCFDDAQMSQSWPDGTLGVAQLHRVQIPGRAPGRRRPHRLRVGSSQRLAESLDVREEGRGTPIT